MGARAEGYTFHDLTMSLPLNLVIYTSTAGHYGHSTLATTIKHYKRALGGDLNLFAGRFCHVKIRPTETDRLPDIIDTLLDSEIKPLVTVGDWKRGLQHGGAYLSDMVRTYGDQTIHSTPYTFAVEDDSPIHLKAGALSQYLEAAVNTLSTNHDILHIRFQRDNVLNVTQPISDLYHRVDTWDLQPLVGRTRDLYLIAKIVTDNARTFENTQCEAALRMAADTLSNHPYRYLCFNPVMASSHHIGAEAYPQIMQTPEFASL